MNAGPGLDALNFALAGAREGFGPFLGVFLQSRGFDPASTGIAMSIAGLAGIAATTPLGSLIDRITAKRAAVVAAVAGIAIGAALIVATSSLGLTALGQVVIGVADTSLAPLIAALTLGIVGQQVYSQRVARNEAFSHAGNAVNAALSAALGYWLGLGWVALAIAVMAAASTAVVLRIDPGTIDHEVARGGNPGSQSTWQALIASHPLLVLGGAAFAFQTANGAMLPFLAQSLAQQGRDPSLTAGAMTVTAQLCMMAAALLVPRLSKRFGNVSLLAAALGIVAIRAGLAAWSSDLWSIALIEVLEGLSMGLAGVCIPALVADVMADSGHASAGLGGVMTAYGAGATLSPILAGLVAQFAGYRAAFLLLGCVALAGLIFWLVGWRLTTAPEPRARPVPRGGREPRTASDRTGP